MKRLSSPLREEDVRSLKLGELVYLDGTVLTGRDKMHLRALRYHREQIKTPELLSGATIFHCGPIMVQDGQEWKVIAMGPTTSSRMDGLEPEMIRNFGIRAIIGKGGMSGETLRAMQETGCVYLAATGGAAVSLSEGVKNVLGQEWGDLGMAECIWIMGVEKLGPFIVAMDAHGGSLYNQVNARVSENVKKMLGD